ncbi:hypothetical protein B0H13DRAFT_2428173 [Mycena leptocephala]|nr:hypothetical protein B0H13DRAFT_2428173 [Mycena leptocephala]
MSRREERTRRESPKKGFAEKARGIGKKERKDKARGNQKEGKEEDKKQNAPVPFHNPRVIPLQRQVFIPNELAPEICAQERVGGGWTQVLFPVSLSVPVSIAVVEEIVVEEGYGGERGARYEGKEMDAASNSSDGSSARNASTSVRNASRSSLNSGGVLKSKLGRRNSNSKPGGGHADCGEVVKVEGERERDTATAQNLGSGCVCRFTAVLGVTGLISGRILPIGSRRTLQSLQYGYSNHIIIPTFTLVYIGLKNTTGGIGQVPFNSGTLPSGY